MPIKAIIKQLEDAPENVRSLYRAGTADEGLDGQFVLDVESQDGWNLENVNGLKTALSAERSEHGQAKQKLKAFEGLDPAAARAAIAKVEELKDIDPKKDVDRLVEEKVQAQLGQLNERHGNEIAARDKRITGRDALLRQTLVHDAALKAIMAEKGDPELLLPHVLPSIQLELEENEETGDITPKTKVVDAKGNVRIGDSQGGNMTIDQLVGELKKNEKFSVMFEGSGHTGTGDHPPRKPNGGGQKKAAQMSRKEKADFITEHGLEAWQEKVRTDSAAAAAS